MAGRTLLQQAVPITFGLKAAGWLVGLDEAAQRLDAVRRSRLAAQLGGAAGTLSAQGDAGIDVLSRFARELGLAEPVLPWHTTRTRIAELATALGEASGAMAKVAGDVVLLAQTEVGEVREGGSGDRGGSSAMPHKHNPVAAISALAGARQAPGLVANLLAAMEHEHERAAGAWHAEWGPLRELLRATGSAAAWLRDCLEHLEVDPERMRANLDDAMLAERVAGAIGGPDAATACARRSPAGARWPTSRASTSPPTRPTACSTRPPTSAPPTSSSTARSARTPIVHDPGGCRTSVVARPHMAGPTFDGKEAVMAGAVDVGYEIAGRDDGPVLVLSNSLGSTGAMWDPQVPRLAERLRVVRYDHRGHGGSPVPPGPYSLDDLGADALALLDRLGLERVHWCGLSLGGMVGMWMAINAPERIDRLVLCCTSARLGPPEMWADRAATVRAEGVEAIADAGIGRWLTEGFIEREPAEDRGGARHARGHARRGLRRLLRGHRAHGPHPRAGRHPRADARHRRPPGPRDAARARRAHRGRHPGRAPRARRRRAPRDHRAAGRHDRVDRRASAGLTLPATF